MSELARLEDNRQWIISIKERIQASQIKAAVAVNRELLDLYWFLGKQILEKQQTARWGDGFLKQISQDLLTEFPEIKRFSFRNLKYMRQWVRFWSGSPAIGQQVAAQLPNPKGQQVAAQLTQDGKQLVSQIPWGHNILLIQKLSDPADAMFYVQRTIENSSYFIFAPLAPVLRGEGLGVRGL